MSLGSILLDTLLIFIFIFLPCIIEIRFTVSEALNHKWIRKTARRSSQLFHTNERSKPFKQYMGLNKLKKAALGYIITNLTEKEIDYLGDMFQQLDTNGNGKLTLEQIEGAIVSSGEIDLQLQKKLRSLREDLALVGNEVIIWKDFLSAMVDKSLLIKEEKIRMVFRHFQKNDNKDVRISDLLDLIGGEECAQDILNMDELRGKIEITYDEFRNFVTQSFTDSEHE